MLRTEAISNFLLNQPYFISKLYTPDMEVQVNVARDDGSPIQGSYAGLRWQGFTDGFQTWKHFRIPWNASINPQYEDKPLHFDLSQHAEGIGMTGWDWKNKVSRWVGFDFDSLIGHKQGLTNESLQQIQRKLEELDFITLLTSTSGNGLHVYVFLDNDEIIQTHTEHAAVARAILSKISALTGLDLLAKVDTLGGNMWVWHRRAIPDQSYILLKEGNPLTELPINWKDYLPQVSKGRIKRSESNIDDLVASKNRTILSDEHIILLKWFENSTSLYWWDDGRQMLVCHTSDLKKAHIDLNLKGFFDTISTGKDHGHDQNCFCFPLPDGGWIIRRHTKGVLEEKIWFTDTSGWTTCYFNKLPSIRVASLLMGGVEGEKEYYFKTLELACRTLLSMNIECEPPVNCELRPAYIKILPDKRLRVTFERSEYDNINDWVMKKKNWEKIFFLPNIIEEIELPDNIVRHLIVESEEFGWYINTNNQWVHENKGNLVNILTTLGYKKQEIDSTLGLCILNNWSLVNKPFQPEYPGNRQWNKGAAQLRYTPIQGHHPTWDIIFNHCGESLTPALLENKWAKDNGIINGLLYLQAWCSSVLQCSANPTPYLFFSGPQNSGKSIFHECLSLLFTGGYCRADQALTNSSGFNGELATAILCIVEETNLSKRGWAYDRIKDWVTGRTISIHIKGKTIYDTPNITHWIQCANDSEYCPVLPGDTRVTLIYVNPIVNEIPKNILLERCEQEAAAFLFTLMNFELPESVGRLRIPVIETYEKQEQMEFNKTLLQRFIDNCIIEIPGQKVLFSEFYQRFQSWADPQERQDWTNRKVAKMLPFVKGKSGGLGELYIGNISFTNDKSPGEPLKRIGDRLC